MEEVQQDTREGKRKTNALEEEIKKNRSRLENATNEKEKTELREVIKSDNQTLHLYLQEMQRKEERLGQQQQQATGEPHADVVLLVFMCCYLTMKLHWPTDFKS